MVLPRLVYVSDTTEVGTVYTKAELSALSMFCKENGLYPHLDGARLALWRASGSGSCCGTGCTSIWPVTPMKWRPSSPGGEGRLPPEIRLVHRRGRGGHPLRRGAGHADRRRVCGPRPSLLHLGCGTLPAVRRGRDSLRDCQYRFEPLQGRGLTTAPSRGCEGWPFPSNPHVCLGEISNFPLAIPHPL